MIRQIANVNIILTPHQVCGQVGIAEYEVPGSDALAERIVAQIKKGLNAVIMENHGLVVTGDYLDRVKAVNTDVNETIRTYLGLEDNFRSVNLEQTETGFKSATPIVVNFVKNNILDKAMRDATPLYPD